MFDPSNEHVMRSHLYGEGYVTMTRPKDLTVDDLDLMQAIVLLQINVFRKHARRRADANAEYESWFPIAAAQGNGDV